jgi:hypothetical protein
MLMCYFGTSISQKSGVMIGPSVDIQRDIVSKSGAGNAGVCFFVFSFEISRNITLGSTCSRDFGEFYFLGVL